ncbi:DUF3098 domain-containing protein [Bacteroides sp.]|uniref:DUF3098 domain-containing protein n=1 Tax=Bacteroides sp. TaxID=29523 RepID=UPI0026238726|nr:DUF3098 domain-containing protein [Bacteroides sp.]MDD3037681.1 DUF3098 domain-containing protein [Bacteroides sp.]
MKTREIKQQETENLFGKVNYIILLVGSILIIVGYILMSGEGSTLTAYNPDIFSDLRICAAPVICLTGYLLNIYGIIYISESRYKKSKSQ